MDVKIRDEIEAMLVDLECSIHEGLGDREERHEFRQKAFKVHDAVLKALDEAMGAPLPTCPICERTIPTQNGPCLWCHED